MNNKCFGRSCFRPWRLPVELYGSKSENLWGVCASWSVYFLVFTTHSIVSQCLIEMQQRNWPYYNNLLILFSFTFRHILTSKAVKDGAMLDLSIRNRQGKTVLHYLGPIFFYKIDWLIWLRFNTQNMRSSNLVYVSKMEYVHKVNIFDLKMMVKSGLKKIILKFLHAEAIFY